jgi:hypothetical protein
MVADFGGYATKAGLKCSDGRTITPEAFKHMDGQRVPLVWQHAHGEASNVLGHAILTARSDGMYAEGFFNTTKGGVTAKELVQHGDITNLSIYANQLVEKTKTVLHGMIREVSLVLSGANPGATIDFVRLQHSGDPNDIEVLEDEAVIHTGLDLEVPEVDEDAPEEDEEEIEHADHSPDDTVQDVYDSMDEEQKNVLHYMIGAALDSASSAEHSDTDEEGLAHKEGTTDMTKRNVFEQNDQETDAPHTLSHSDVKGIVHDAIRGGSLKDAVENYALAHGITNIDLLFPDAKTLADRPEFNKRRTEWVDRVLADTSHSPFSRVKTLTADLTQDEARAKGYIKGNYKKEEWFGVTKRTTSPTTVYKKQKLDRDDVLDIVDFDVVAWLKQEMRMMLDEEIARAILIGDGRDVGDIDKIKDPVGAADGVGIRSIVNDHELFATTVYVNVDDASSNYDEVVDSVLDGFEFYKGSGTPDFYCTIRTLNMFLKAKDTQGRRLYNTRTDVAAALGVASIITVESMYDVSDLVGVIVNLRDYNIGTDRGGEVTMFDDFDIDYNQQKYLIEARMSGALTKIKSALVVRKTAAGNALVVPTSPTFVSSTGVITIPTQTGVVYKNAAGTTLTAGAQTALAAGASLVVNAFPATNYYFPDNQRDGWTFKRPLV